MKKLLFLALFVTSALNVSAFKTFVFKGHGEWKDANGGKGHYSFILEKKFYDHNKVSLTGFMTKGEERHLWAVNIEKNEHGRVTVLNTKGEPIGWGYSYVMDEVGQKVCHVEYMYGDYKVEATIHGNLDKMNAIGSMKDANGAVTTWIERAHRIFP